MPTPAYISIEGSTQGSITQGAFTEASVGNIWQEGHENEILVQAIEHRVTIPRDPPVRSAPRASASTCHSSSPPR